MTFEHFLRTYLNSGHDHFVFKTELVNDRLQIMAHVQGNTNTLQYFLVNGNQLSPLDPLRPTKTVA